MIDETESLRHKEIHKKNPKYLQTQKVPFAVFFYFSLSLFLAVYLLMSLLTKCASGAKRIFYIGFLLKSSIFTLRIDQKQKSPGLKSCVIDDDVCLSSFPRIYHHRIRLVTECVLTWATLLVPTYGSGSVPPLGQHTMIISLIYWGGFRPAQILVFKIVFVSAVSCFGLLKFVIDINIWVWIFLWYQSLWTYQQFIFCSNFCNV